MRAVQTSIVASAFILLLAGCGGGGGSDGDKAVKSNPEKTEFDNFGNNVKGVVEFQNEVPGSPSRKYEIKKVTANMCKAKETFSPAEFTLNAPSDKDPNKPSVQSVEFNLQFEENTGSKATDLSKKCITDKVIIDYEIIAANGARFKEQKTITNPSYDQSKVYAEAGNDPLYKHQWHLKNTGQSFGASTPAVAGNDINVEGVWQDGITGKGVVVAVIDDGIDIFHPDLKDNILVNLSHNYHTGRHNTAPFRGVLTGADGKKTGGYHDFPHGTAVAGLIAAKGWNGIGSRGVAPNVNLVSFNALEIFVTEAEDFFKNNQIPYTNTNAGLSLNRQLDAFVKHLDKVDIYNNSWGYSGADIFGKDQKAFMYFADKIDDQLKYGVIHGRDKKGAIYVKAAGNGGLDNFDRMQTNGYFVVVSASGADGTASGYTTTGTNIIVNAPGGGKQHNVVKPNEHMIVTTDLAGEQRGYDANVKFEQNANHFPVKGNENYDYTQRMNGTSASAPIVSGVVALMLEANPNLTWRDVRYILARSAHRNDFSSASWNRNGAGLYYSNSYGFGRVDAQAAVTMARNFNSLGGYYDMDITTYNGTGGSSSNTITRRLNVPAANNVIIEHASVSFSLDLNSSEIQFDTITRNGSGNAQSTVTLNKGNNNFTITNLDENTTISATIRSATSQTEKSIGNLDTNGTARNSLKIEETGKYVLAVESNSTRWQIAIQTPREYAKANNIDITLTSPSGTKSHLIKGLNELDNNTSYSNVRLSSVEFLDERSAGRWTIEIENKGSGNTNSFALSNWELEIRGRK